MGVVGAGSLGYHHVRILREIEGAELVGFVDIDGARAAEVAGDLGVSAYDTLDALLDAVEALTVAVPTPSHHVVAKVALERG